jgi:hypothetical protein
MTEQEMLMIEAARRGLLPAPAAQSQPAGILGGFAEMARAQGRTVPTEQNVTAMQRGVLRGMRDPVDAGAQLLTRAGELLPGAGGRFFAGERQRVEDINRTGEAQFQQEAGQIEGSGLGRGIGNVIATAPLAVATGPTIGGAAIAGGAAGALQPVNDAPNAADFWLEKAMQTGAGAAVSGATAGAVKGLSRLISPKSTPQVRAMMDEGIAPTPGQVIGGPAKAMEEKATSIPFVGDAIKRGQMRAVEDFNRASINKALKPIGKQLDMKTPLGREAIDEAFTKIDDAYDSLLPRVTFKADQQFLSEINNLRTLAQNMPKASAEQFDNVLRNEVLSKINPNTGQTSGETFKRITSELGRMARQYRGSSVASERDLGSAFQELQRALRNTLSRVNPDQATELAAADGAYALMLRVGNAAGRAGSKEGVFSPAALRGAVRQMDSSMRKKAFARGDALMQDFAESAENVLGPRVPDSGTAGRAMLPLSIPAALAYADPLMATGAATAMLPYTPMGQRAFANMMTQRAPAAGQFSSLLDLLAPYAGAGAAGAVRR